MEEVDGAVFPAVWVVGVMMKYIELHASDGYCLSWVSSWFQFCESMHL